ncbi:integral membrane protein [Anopheles sinensis]|uniref:Integral membrane protein n=1 Tax=Anopheles sinensis TaxID=74873 RepID=A0A084W1L1_ANOSI|nr:integral membrane protein [Anopheles sinensis]
METLFSRFERNPRMLVTTFWGDPVAPNSELPSFESSAFDSPAAALPVFSPEAATVTGVRAGATDPCRELHTNERILTL